MEVYSLRLLAIHMPANEVCNPHLYNQDHTIEAFHEILDSIFIDLFLGNSIGLMITILIGKSIVVLGLKFSTAISQC